MISNFGKELFLKHPKMAWNSEEKPPRSNRLESPISAMDQPTDFSNHDSTKTSVYQVSGVKTVCVFTFSTNRQSKASKADCSLSTMEELPRNFKHGTKRQRDECDDDSLLKSGRSQPSGTRKWIGSRCKSGAPIDQRYNYGVYPQLKKSGKMCFPPRREFIPVEGGRPLQDQELEFFLTRNSLISSMYGMSISKKGTRKRKKICRSSQEQEREWEVIQGSRCIRRCFSQIKEERIQAITISKEDMREIDDRYCNLGSSNVPHEHRRMKEIARDKKKLPISKKADTILSVLFTPQSLTDVRF